MRRDRCHSGGFLLRIMPPSWHPVPACTRNGHNAGGPFIPCDNDKTTGGQFYFAATTKRQAGRYTCRHDGVASILDFKLKLANRCSAEVKTGVIRASILYFKPRLANRCSKEVKTRAIRASILDFRPRLGNRCSIEVRFRYFRASIRDFRPRLANRCSKEVKTGAIRAAILDFSPRLANRCIRVAHSWGHPSSPRAEALFRGRGMPDGQGLRTA